jgi:hypothetical protein
MMATYDFGQPGLRTLGVQRLISQPASCNPGDRGMLYTFPASTGQPVVQLQLQPMHVGTGQFHLRSSTSELLSAKFLILP